MVQNLAEAWILGHNGSVASPTQKRLALFSSALAALGIVLWYAFWGRERHWNQRSDNQAALKALLDERARGSDASESLGPWPPILVREPMPEEIARKFYPALEQQSYCFDPISGLRRAANIRSYRPFELHPEGGWKYRTNSLGLREHLDPPQVPFEESYLVLGDSQTEGVCATEESYPNQLECMLNGLREGPDLQVWNGATGGTGPYHYLGTLERLWMLEPKIVIATFYGGNDFSNTVAISKYFHRRPAPLPPAEWSEPVEGEEAISQALGFAELNQLAFFASNIDEKRMAVGISAAIALEMRRQCQERGVRFYCAYLAPPLCAQPELYALERESLTRRLALHGMKIELSDELANEWIALLATQDLEVIDLRPIVRAQSQRLFWEDEWHLTPEGNELIATTLLQVLQERQ